MKKEILNFYAEKGFHVRKLITRRPDNLTPEQIEAAAVEVYNQIQDGLQIKQINIYRHIKEVARDIDARQYAEDRKLIDDSKEIIAEKDMRFRRLALGAVILSVLVGIDIIARLLQWK